MKYNRIQYHEKLRLKQQANKKVQNAQKRAHYKRFFRRHHKMVIGGFLIVFACMFTAFYRISSSSPHISSTNESGTEKVNYKQSSTISHKPSHTRRLTYKERVYMLVKKRDIKKLHKIGNLHCKMTNRRDHYKKYTKSKDGNYWSYYKTHICPINHNNHTEIKENHKLLRRHGIYTGVNFSLDNNYHKNAISHHKYDVSNDKHVNSDLPRSNKYSSHYISKSSDRSQRIKPNDSSGSEKSTVNTNKFTQTTPSKSTGYQSNGNNSNKPISNQIVKGTK